jgi:hypothetical protein
LWVNGSIDPWHALGVLEVPTDAPFQILVINGTGTPLYLSFPSSPPHSINDPLKAHSQILSTFSGTPSSLALPFPPPHPFSFPVLIIFYSSLCRHDTPIFRLPKHPCPSASGHQATTGYLDI